MQNPSVVRIGRRRRRSRNKSKFLQRLRTAFLLLCFVALLATVGMVAGAVGTYQALAADMPDLDDYRSAELAQTSLVYDANGKVVDQLYGVQNRFVVPLEGVDPTLRQAIISIEDHRFHEHRGLDFEAIGRAAVENIQSLSIQEGGSTLTQQLIKNTYIAQQQRFIPSFERKFVEASLAWQYEKGHSKRRDPGAVPQHRVLRGQRLRRRGRGQDLLQQEMPSTSRSRSLRFWPGSSTSPASTTRSSTPRARRRGATWCSTGCSSTATSSKKEHDRAVASEVVLSRGRVEYQNDNEYFLNAVRKGDSRGVRRRHASTRGDSRSTPPSTPTCKRWRARPSTPS